MAKKRGYETPPEYLEWLRSLTPEEEQEALSIDERAADHDNTEEALQQVRQKTLILESRPCIIMKKRQTNIAGIVRCGRGLCVP